MAGGVYMSPGHADVRYRGARQVRRHNFLHSALPDI